MKGLYRYKINSTGLVLLKSSTQWTSMNRKPLILNREIPARKNPFNLKHFDEITFKIPYEFMVNE